MSTSAVSTPNVSSSSERLTGRVKWFNNKSGYGFITVTDGDKSGSDVFVHHSSIKVDSEQYKYLVQGEYVDFNLSTTKNSAHEFQAGEVYGIKGGKLMCETRHESRVARSQYRYSSSEQEQYPEQEDSFEPVKMPRSVAPPKDRRQDFSRTNSRSQEFSRETSHDEQGRWSYVAKTRKPEQAPQRTNGTGRPPRQSHPRL
jgi:CspA family cold shock protein